MRNKGSIRIRLSGNAVSAICMIHMGGAFHIIHTAIFEMPLFLMEVVDENQL